jgi:transcriptional regulator with XRE-family HTH domain
MGISGRQVAAARELLGISQDELALAVNIAASTLRRFENGQHSPRPLTLHAIQTELERRNIEFLNTGGVGVFLQSKT